MFALFDFLRMTDQDKEDFIRRYIHWQQNGLDLEERNPLVLNFGADMALNYPQIRYYLTEGACACYIKLSYGNLRIVVISIPLLSNRKGNKTEM